MDSSLQYPPVTDLDHIGPEIFDDYSDIDSLIRMTKPFLRSEYDMKCDTNQYNAITTTTTDDEDLDQLIVLPLIEQQTIATTTASTDMMSNYCQPEYNDNCDQTPEEVLNVCEQLSDNNSSNDCNNNYNSSHKRMKRNKGIKSCETKHVSNEKIIDMKLSKKISDIKYRSKMKEQYEKLSYAIIGRDVKWRKKELLDLSVKYILHLKRSNKQLMIENMKLKHQIANGF